MNTENQTIACDVVLLPNDEQAAEAVKCSQALAGQGTLFTLDNQNFYAHASLYMFQADVNRLAVLTNALQTIAAIYEPQELVQTGYNYLDSGPGKGFVDIMFERNTTVDQLQTAVVETLSSLRTGMVKIIEPMLVNATGLKLENLQKHGYPAVGELFRPHITLTKFPAETEPDLTTLPDPTIFTGRFTKIGLFEMGDNGTCVRPLTTFDL